jgi:HEAT repeat protein
MDMHDMVKMKANGDVEGLMKMVRNQDRDELLCVAAMDCLSQLNAKPPVGALIEVLDDPDQHVRNWAATTLGGMKDTRAVVPLIRALDDNYVRLSAIRALGLIEDARAIDPLARILDDPNILVRRGVIEALGNIKDDRAIAPLTKALDDTDSTLRSSAAEALKRAQMGSSDVEQMRAHADFEGLIRALRNNDSVQVRINAATALGNLRNPRAVEPLVAALEDDGVTYRQLGEQELPDDSVRAAAIEALGQIGDKRAIEPLNRALEHGDYFAEREAPEALRKIKANRRWWNR